MNRIVIVGGGLAGMRAAERLREIAFSGEIVIVGDENQLPYHRPALTKGFLDGHLNAADLTIEPLLELDAVWRTGTTASQLDPKRRVVSLPGGEELAYDGLIIATGVEARRLPGGPHGHPRVAVIRTIADARRVQRSIAGSHKPVVVIGSGFIGGEVASTLKAMDRDVTIVGRSQGLMGNVLGPELGQQMADLHWRNDVQLELGVRIEDWDLHDPDNVGIRLSSGKILDAGCVIVAVGSVPVVGWLRDAGVQVDDGLLCEPTCHVIGLADVVAAGDVAQWTNRRFAERPRRVEHWTNAIEMGRAAAENLLAGRALARPFEPLPRFWSEQHGVRIHAAGIPPLGTERVVLEQDPTGARSVTAYLRDHRPVGIVGLNSSPAVLTYTEELLERRGLPDPGTWSRKPAPARRVSFLEAVRSA